MSNQQDTVWSTSYKYTLYGWDISYFTGKIQCYLRYKEIPHDFKEPCWWELSTFIQHNTGLMKVPVIQAILKNPDESGSSSKKKKYDKNLAANQELPKEIWLQDSTPMIEWFEERFPKGSVIPQDPFQAFFVRLVEDYADEWMWRPALHFRWSYSTDARLYCERFYNEFLYDQPVPKFLIKYLTWDRQIKEYITGDGIRDKQTREHVENTYFTALKRLQAIFEETPFLLGDKPSLADFGFFASMFRHFGLDPTPSKIMRYQAPAVYEWLARMWNAKYSKYDSTAKNVSNAASVNSKKGNNSSANSNENSNSGKKDWPKEGTLPKTWTPLLEDIGRTYLPYLYDNAVAFKNNDKNFDCTVEGVTYRALPVVPYRVWCRERLQQHYAELPPDVQNKVKEVLEKTGCWKPFNEGGVIPSHLHTSDNPAPPVCTPAKRKDTYVESWIRYSQGTTWTKLDNPSLLFTPGGRNLIGFLLMYAVTFALFMCALYGSYKLFV